MGLEDFEKELAQGKVRENLSKGRSHRDREQDGERERRHRYHHQDRDKRGDDDRGRRHRHKRHRVRDDDDERRRHRKRQRGVSSKPVPSEKHKEDVKVVDMDDEGEDEWVEKGADAAPAAEDILDQRDRDVEESASGAQASKMQRDAWMTEPSALDIDYVQRSQRAQEHPKGQFVSAKELHAFKVHNSEVDQHLADLQKDLESDDEDGCGGVTLKDEPAQHEVTYNFGDAGSSWRMTKLKAVYRQAEESGKSVDDVAVERYGDMRDFDDAREEERELDRRKTHGKEYVGLQKPSGELFQERKLKAGIHRELPGERQSESELRPQGQEMSEAALAVKTVQLDTTALNKLKAQMMKAKLRNAPEAPRLEEEYNLAGSAGIANQAQSDIILLDQMENRMLAGGRSGEVTALSGKRARERGTVEENEDMSIADMVKQEKRTRGQFGGESRGLAERIAKDAKFENDLEYMDDNATKLSKKIVKSDIYLRNTAIGDFKKMQRVLENCPLCYHEDSDPPRLPTAPVVSLATCTYLTLPTEPELAKHGAVIVPIQHRFNLLECDDDEWEEIRNFMKSLTRFYASRDLGVIFYENAAFSHSRKGHAALNAVPLPHHLADAAPAYFKEALLSSDEQWSQHKPVLDTLALSQKPGGFGKQAFRKALAKEMPYFHVWLGLDGGMGHVVEDERRWPKGDLFAREVLGGMLDRRPEVIKRQGRWERGDRRVEAFKGKWRQFDWTKVLMEGT